MVSCSLVFAQLGATAARPASAPVRPSGHGVLSHHVPSAGNHIVPLVAPKALASTAVAAAPTAAEAAAAAEPPAPAAAPAEPRQRITSML